jgi:hypothetical protein
MAQKINAIEMTRRIRDKHYRHLRGSSTSERLAFYRTQAKRMNATAAKMAARKRRKSPETAKA